MTSIDFIKREDLVRRLIAENERLRAALQQAANDAFGLCGRMEAVLRSNEQKTPGSANPYHRELQKKLDR